MASDAVGQLNLGANCQGHWFLDLGTDTCEAVGPGIFWVMAEDAIIPAVSAVSLVLNET